MNNFKKAILIILSVVMMSFVFGCGSDGNDGPQRPPDYVPEEIVDPINEWPEPAPPGSNHSDFTHPNLIWQDEFNGDTLNTDYWEIQTGTGAHMGLTGWGNLEQQYYRPDNIRVNNGRLQIIARTDGFGGMPYTSGRIRSARNFSVRFGRIEARLRVPIGAGFWPAFWMMPEPVNATTEAGVHGGWPNSGEIDIFEARGREPGVATAAIHYNANGPGVSPSNNTHMSFSRPLAMVQPGLTINDFVTYAVEWDDLGTDFYGVPDGSVRIRWFINDLMAGAFNMFNVPGTLTNPNAPFDEEFHLLLNLAIGGNFDGGVRPPTSAFAPAIMEVDWVRVFALPNVETRYTINGVTNYRTGIVV